MVWYVWSRRSIQMSMFPRNAELCDVTAGDTGFECIVIDQPTSLTPARRKHLQQLLRICGLTSYLNGFNSL